MDLKIKDIVKLLNVSEKTVYRWIQEKKIPCYRINHQYRFSRSEINEWILSKKIELSPRLYELAIAGRKTRFTDLLLKGDIYYNIPGNNPHDVLYYAVSQINTPEGLSKEEIANAVVNRERMMTTAIGRGIAIPHPRHPILSNEDDDRVAICFLQKPIDFGALDGRPVHTLFIVLVTLPKRHLEILSKISYLCSMDEFVRLLENRASKNEIISFVQRREEEWLNKIPTAI
ncbi:MAG: PTS sugar transporter subunit IIA [candidate division KSB1 bacterium]|nr:PTS sugar transporter subunit IIA [candidate division KSB1 bacterium]